MTLKNTYTTPNFKPWKKKVAKVKEKITKLKQKKPAQTKPLLTDPDVKKRI